MASKSKGRSWIDVQIAIITISMSVVLVLWNLFASTDRVKAEQKAAEALANPPEPVETPVEVTTTVSPMLAPGEKLILGGEAPETVVTIEKVIRRNNGGGGGDGGGGGGGTTSTSSS